jgi:hypothetical protein
MGVSQQIEKRKTMLGTKPIASMQKGGMVKQTGMYKLHKGERVIPAKDVKKVDSMMKQMKKK